MNFITHFLIILSIHIWLVSSFVPKRYAPLFYHSDKEIQKQIDKISKHSLFKKVKCSNDQDYGYLEIGKSDSKMKAIVTCNIHAVQLISAEICLSWIKGLTKKQKILDNYHIKIFYIGNKVRQQVYNDQVMCFRKNQGDVDLNRNFPTDFDHYHFGKFHPLYPGKKPINQPFTICLSKLLQQQKPDLFIDIHSGMDNKLFYQEGINNQNQIQILQEVKRQFIKNGSITTLKKEGQPINGHIFADLKVRLKVPLSFLFQTYKQNIKEEGYVGECFLNYNPLGKKKHLVIQKYRNILNFVFQKILKTRKD